PARPPQPASCEPPPPTAGDRPCACRRRVQATLASRCSHSVRRGCWSSRVPAASDSISGVCRLVRLVVGSAFLYFDHSWCLKYRFYKLLPRPNRFNRTEKGSPILIFFHKCQTNTALPHRNTSAIVQHLPNRHTAPTE